ncbi:helix-turn-helix domain-containing protein [Streptomyces sp. NPDC057253]|uniref:helix-turn-helix domain-containing protein n=1 Tax=Streptomyces sp. NPDC057253 TaxID=3346069 RepID=UPI003632B316
MPEQTPTGAAHLPTDRGPGDLGRRLAGRREELGLTRQEVADRAGVDPGYLRYLEETPAVAPGVSTLLRLADALETGVTVLTGGEVDLPPGRGRASRTAESVELGTDECWERLSTHGVGRLGMITGEGVTILPVNYSVVDGVIAFRTAPGSLPATVLGEQVAFEADHLDDVLRHGWSVLVRGRARGVTRPDEVRRLTERAYSEPWAGGRRDLWVCLEPAAITGRLIRERTAGGG